jgi:hypothetical protein
MGEDLPRPCPRIAPSHPTPLCSLWSERSGYLHLLQTPL